MWISQMMPERARWFLDNLQAEAANIAKHPREDFTHRTAGFIRNKSSTGQSSVKLELCSVAAYWVSREGYVYYDNKGNDPFFNLPLATRDGPLVRGDSSCFDYPEIISASIVEGLGDPRPYTPEEGAENLINHLIGLTRYWSDTIPSSELNPVNIREMSLVRDRLEGFLFSTLAMLDGSSIGVPSFFLVPHVPQEDIDYHKSMGDNYYPHFDPPEGTIPAIAPNLHEIYSAMKRSK